MTSTTTDTSSSRCPQLLAASMVATPILFFVILAITGPLGHFALYLLVAWTLAAITSTSTYVIDRQYIEQFSLSERLAMLAANGMVALLVAAAGFASAGFA